MVLKTASILQTTILQIFKKKMFFSLSNSQVNTFNSQETSNDVDMVQAESTVDGSVDGSVSDAIGKVRTVLLLIIISILIQDFLKYNEPLLLHNYAANSFECISFDENLY